MTKHVKFPQEFKVRVWLQQDINSLLTPLLVLYLIYTYLTLGLMINTYKSDNNEPGVLYTCNMCIDTVCCEWNAMRTKQR